MKGLKEKKRSGNSNKRFISQNLVIHVSATVRVISGTCTPTVDFCGKQGWG